MSTVSRIIVWGLVAIAVIAIAATVAWEIARRPPPPLISESVGIYWGCRGKYGPPVPEDYESPVFRRLTRMLAEEGFAATISTSAPPAEKIGFESRHLVVSFNLGTITGTLEHYGQGPGDQFNLEAQAANDEDDHRTNYYLFRDKMEAIIENYYNKK